MKIKALAPIIFLSASLAFLFGCAPIGRQGPSPEPYVGSELRTISSGKGAISASGLPFRCTQATVDTPPVDVCQIDVNVSFDPSMQCIVTVTPNVQLDPRHRQIHWVIKQSAGPPVEFANITGGLPIQFTDPGAFRIVRQTKQRVVGFPLQPNKDAYYFIFLQWFDGKRTQLCIADPIVNND